MSAILLATLFQIANLPSPSANLINQITSIAAITQPPVLGNQSANPQELLEQGLKLYQNEQYSSALKIFKQTDEALQATGDRLNQALVLSYLSLTYQQLGQLPDAQQTIDKSLKLLQNKSNSKDYLSIRAQALNTQGRIQLAQGQTEKSLSSWEEATATYSKIGDEAGKIGSQINQTQALQTLGLYRRATNTLENVKLTLDQQPDSLIKATGLLSLGNTLRVVGDLNKSQQILEVGCQIQAKRLRLEELCQLETQLNLVNTAQTPLKIEAEKLAEILLSLGNTAQAQQSTEAALKYYERAASISQNQTTQLQAQLNKLRVLVNLLTTSVKKEPSSEIQNLLQQILPEIQSLPAKLENLPASRSSVYAQINFAQSLVKLAKTGVSIQGTISDQNSCTSVSSLCMAAKVVATGVKQAKILSDVRAQAYALGTLGSLYEQTQQWTEAQSLTQQALKLAEAIQAKDIAYRWQWQLGRILSASSNPQGNDKVAIARSAVPEAIAAYDKAVKILKALRRDLVTVNRDAQFSFRDEVEPVYREYVSLLLPKTGETSPENLDKARKVIESLQLAELDNFFRRACLDTQPVQIDKIDQQRQTAVIYPIVLSDRLAIILSLPNQPKSKSLQLRTVVIAKTTFEDKIKELRRKILLKSPRDFLHISQQIYDWLIRPIESDLHNSGVQNLVFVLDGTLQSIPIAALYDQQKKQYLVQKKYNIAITPGLELLPPQPLSKKRLQAVVGGLSEGRDDFPPLPGVKYELEQIKLIFSTAQNFIDNNFTIKNIEEAVESFPGSILHLATHGQFSSKAEDTFILTWNKRVNVNDLNSVLKTRQTSQQGAINLLVLSACETAAGDSRATLGIAGIALQSGALSTLATLWSVNDEATAVLMIEFYKEIAQNQKKAEALRNAQLFLLSGELSYKFKHPYYWAPFVLVGNWD
ncbi:MAG: CHAT domain-containing protein [Mojavia pulchra JT2-VF2]|jgi:CHAT domain-containing protein|uniref:CHAT domain-containing protein n=1 Tax=Mojavia pulchra JT2-VF2 TaxID=287848 RepID=A0A951PZC3_9NOST|nr:CHAT domain-containing protein [Mojavia pulchra JT2-VF2]